jgi:3-oxoadipate enol-lactonase
LPVYNNDQASFNYLDPAPQNSQVVLLLHGLGTEGSSWIYQIQALVAAGYRPVAPDLPGFGQSRFLGKRWSIKNTAHTVVDLMLNLKAERFHIAGISMGGAIALQSTLDFPERIASLVLINTFATLRPKRANEWYYLLRRYFKARIGGAGSQAEITAHRIFPRPDQEMLRQELMLHIRQTDPEVYTTAMHELGTFDVLKSLKNLHLPVLILSGENDTTVPLENQHDLAVGIPGSLQVMIQKAGHGMIVDKPLDVNSQLINFLRQHSI